eukprot:TRINITY_DN937_c0_g1_i6.p5 TRINITY_DN937_c0_g1~~TRINITY_DN937_c0_g1_i6.p5  ORF type:complete len:108 (-),score=28.41 TRINITY_DN937_c0_g1_i6:991-1314(-)
MVMKSACMVDLIAYRLSSLGTGEGEGEGDGVGVGGGESEGEGDGVGVGGGESEGEGEGEGEVEGDDESGGEDVGGGIVEVIGLVVAAIVEMESGAGGGVDIAVRVSS